MAQNEIDVTCPRCQQKLKLGLYTPKEAYQNKPEQTKTPLNIKDIEAIFDPDIAKNLTFQAKDENTIIIKPRKYLGKQTFWKIANQIKTLGGDYVSNGKNSYFWIPRQQLG